MLKCSNPIIIRFVKESRRVAGLSATWPTRAPTLPRTTNGLRSTTSSTSKRNRDGSKTPDSEGPRSLAFTKKIPRTFAAAEDSRSSKLSIECSRGSCFPIGKLRIAL
jgi:hypothetical protein